MEYLCCCRCIYDTEEKNIKKSIVKLTDIIVSEVGANVVGTNVVGTNVNIVD